MNTVTPLSAPLRAENLTLGYDKKSWQATCPSPFRTAS